MKPSDHSEESLFQRCLDLPPEEWESFLNKTCGENETLRESVLSLLRSHQKQGGFLDSVPPGGSEPPATPTFPSDPAKEQPAPDRPSRFYRILWMSGLFLVVLMAGWLLLGHREEQSEPTLTVASFDLIASESLDGSFVSKLQNELIQYLMPVGDFEVVSNTESKSKRVNEAGKSLLLRGELHAVGKTLRIHASLVDRFNNRVLWNASFNRILSEENEHLVQLEISDTISRGVRKSLGVSGAGILPPALSHDSQALEHYEMGMDILRCDLKTEMPAAIKHFRKATASDPNFIHAYVGLARAYQQSGGLIKDNIPEDRRVQLWTEAAETAAAINNHHPQVQVLLGELQLEQGDASGALSAFKRALRLDPECAEAYMGLGKLELKKIRTAGGRDISRLLEEAISQIQKAVELDPDNASFLYELGYVFGWQARTEESLKTYQRSVAVNPRYARGYMAIASIAINFTGRLDEAIIPLRKAVFLDPKNEEYRIDIRNCYANLDDRKKELSLTKQIVQAKGEETTIYHAGLFRLQEMEDRAYECYEHLLKSSQDPLAVDRARRRLLNYDLRNERYEESRRRYFAMDISLFQEKPVVQSEGQAILALELAPILIALGETDSVDDLADGAWNFYKEIPEGHWYRAFCETLVHICKGDTKPALDAFEVAINTGLRDQLHLEDARLDPLREEPRFKEAMHIVEHDLAAQRTTLQRMEENGELESIPEL